MDLLAHLKSETHRGGAGTAERPLCGGADCPEGTRLRPCPRGGRPLVQKGTELWHSLLSPPTLLGFCQAFASTDVRCYRTLGGGDGAGLLHGGADDMGAGAPESQSKGAGPAGGPGEASWMAGFLNWV